jgi:hypothetical protein
VKAKARPARVWQVVVSFGTIFLLSGLILAQLAGDNRKEDAGPYNFELSFTRLSIFTLRGQKDAPSEVNILLAKVPGSGSVLKHYPRLSCQARDIFTIPIPKEFVLYPSPSGVELALRNLEGETVTVEPPKKFSPRPLKLHWAPGRLELKPRIAAEEAYLDWVAPLAKVWPTILPPTGDMPFAGLKDSAVSSVIHMESGDLKAADFPLRKSDGQYVTWKFQETPDETGAHEQALAGRMILTFSGLNRKDSVTLKFASGTVVHLKPRAGSPDKVVQVSISNLPDHEMSDPQLSLADFGELKELAKVKPEAKPKLPRTKDGIIVTTTNTFCPPGGHGG